jgi:CubicO group peptidase (beta-lactamase class C family)
MKKLIGLIPLFIASHSFAQSLYFPPITGNTWDTISPASLGWCQSNIDSLYSYLEGTNTDAFIVLKDGKIVLEKYFGTFTVDSIHYWASAGKSLTSTLIGIAQEKKLLDIDKPVSNYVGVGWTSETPVQEDSITIRNLLTMTGGLNDDPPLPCENTDSSKDCLVYLTAAGTRWAYHTGAYYHLLSVLSTVTGLSDYAYTNNFIGSQIGLTGLWFQGTFYSTPRGMARFGLLSLNKDVWAGDTLLHDTNYYNAMINTSQAFNLSYGYLWWLNGKSSFMGPGLQFIFPGPLVPNAPPDMFAALGKNDQKIYIAPSQGLVVVRTGNSSYGVADAFSPFDNDIWGKIDSLGIACQYTFTGNGNWDVAANWSNNLIPPQVLQDGGQIHIVPSVGGVCNLNIPQTVSQKSSITVADGARFNILGNLNILK